MGKKSDKRLQKRLEKTAKSKNDAFSSQTFIQQTNENESEYLAFSLRNLTKNYNLCTKKCNNTIRSQLMLKLHELSCYTWTSLLLKKKNSGGVEKVNRKMFKVPLPECITDEIENLYIFRFNGQNSRIVGYRLDNIFHIIFVDVDLSTYEH